MTVDDPTVADVLRDLQITHGNPTAEELAIVAAIVSATGQAGHPLASHLAGPSPVSNEWSRPGRRLRRALPAGGWVSSLRR